MSETINSVVYDFVVEDFLYGDGEVHPDEDLIEAGVLDSMTFLRLIEFLHERFGVEVNLGDLTMDRFSTINRVVSYLIAQGATV